MECLVLFFYAKTKQFTESGKQIVPDQTALEQSDQELFCLHKLFLFGWFGSTELVRWGEWWDWEFPFSME